MTDPEGVTVPRARKLPLRLPPNAGVERWPVQPCADPAAEKVRQLAARLEEVMGDRGLSARAVAEHAGIGVGTVQVIQRGTNWPDVRAVARLEVALDVDLWPRHSA